MRLMLGQRRRRRANIGIISRVYNMYVSNVDPKLKQHCEQCLWLFMAHVIRLTNQTRSLHKQDYMPCTNPNTTQFKYIYVHLGSEIIG